MAVDDVELPRLRAFLDGGPETHNAVMASGWSASIMQQTCIRAMAKLELACESRLRKAEMTRAAEADAHDFGDERPFRTAGDFVGAAPGGRGGSGGGGESQGAGGTSVLDRERVFGCDMVRYRGLEEKRAAVCAASGFLEPDDCLAAPVMTGGRCVQNLPDRPCGG